MKLTKAQRNALAAVERGEVTRRYDKRGNSFRGPQGIGARAYWSLERARLIEDGPDNARGLDVTVTMQPTAKGRAALTV